MTGTKKAYAANRGSRGEHAGYFGAPVCLHLAALVVIAAILLAGCSGSNVFTGEIKDNKLPTIELTNGPIEGDTTLYTVHFFWLGEDEDGTIDHYEFCMAEGDPVGFDPADTVGAWLRTNLTDSVFAVSADNYDRNVEINRSLYGKFKKTHTFFIRAIDDRGSASETISRSFTAFTLAPHIIINYPYATNLDSGAQKLSVVSTFMWYGKDPIDAPWNYQEVDSVRYLYAFYYTGLIDALNRNPGEFEDMWSDWIWYHAEGDSGKQTTLGDDELLETNRSYILAVQAKDEAGAVSSIFNKRTNVRHFMAMQPTGPVLRINEPFLGTFSFLGLDFRPEKVDVPPGFEMNWTWTGDASSYGGVVQSFRYGWDIADFNDPTEWEVFPSPYISSAGPTTFYSGIHTLYVESADNLGTKTLGTIEVTVIPIIMTRDLLWVDDFPSLDFAQMIYAFPTESEHDRFWKDICLKVKGFDPSRDIYDIKENDFYVPPLALIFKYRNIIWSFSKAIDPEAGSVWNRIVKYTPSGTAGLLNLNFLTYYLAFGGHLWTVGEGHRSASLAACLENNLFPLYIRCEFWGSSLSCSNTTGASTMAYRDFCVSALDKAEGLFPKYYLGVRRPDYDAMRNAYLDRSDPLIAGMEWLPHKLELWDTVTRPGMFFDLFVRGFHYVEYYDPEYYMSYLGKNSQSCFHPMYRATTMNSWSVVFNSTVAFWYSKYAGVKASPAGCIAAPSVHIGFPLWFFDRAQVDSLSTAIFKTWQLPLVQDDFVSD
ncbi:MAG: hypothetical protein KAU49_04035 [Candidatus Krumholzibacteria bacterium]|nr:hypothetical protein [Candidatus Krumholzibacteria bacterium]